MSIRISLAGATRWASSALQHAIAKSNERTLVSALSRTHAQHNPGEVLSDTRLNCPVYATDLEALAHPRDVFFEFTKPDVAQANVLANLDHGAHVVIDTTGLTEADYAESSAQPYGDGALLAIRKVNSFVGLRRGLDHILDL